MSITGADLVATALKLLGVYQAGETLRAADAADGFARLNAFVDFLTTQRLSMNGIQKFTGDVIAGHNPYTIGLAQDFNQVRPTWIDDVTITINVGTSTATDIPIAEWQQDEYANAAAKAVQAALPTNYYYNATYDLSVPSGAIYFWPIPNNATYDLNLWCPVATIGSFATPTTAYKLLPGWQAMLETNLAVELSSLFGVEVPAVVAAKANATLNTIKRVNTEPGLLSVDNGLLKTAAQTGGGNWLTGP